MPQRELAPSQLADIGHFTEHGLKRIGHAVEFARKHHHGQLRVGGASFITHPIAVAQLLVDRFDADVDTVIASLLHDVVEDTEATLDQIEAEFGPTIRFLVDGTTEVGKGDGSPRLEDRSERVKRTQEKVRKYGAQDSRVYLVKIADRWHNLMTCYGMRPASQARNAQEALDFHAPLCKELGYKQQASELSRLAEDIVTRNS